MAARASAAAGCSTSSNSVLSDWTISGPSFTSLQAARRLSIVANPDPGALVPALCRAWAALFGAVRSAVPAFGPGCSGCWPRCGATRRAERGSGAKTQRADPAGQDPAGQDPAGQDPAGQDPAGQDPAGQDPARQAPAGQHPAGQDPAGGRVGGGHSGSSPSRTAVIRCTG